MSFIWTDKEDEELYRNGITIMWMAGRSKAIQKFVEALSYKIGSKCDFSFTAGRAHIDVSKDGYDKDEMNKDNDLRGLEDAQKDGKSENGKSKDKKVTTEKSVDR